MLILKRTLLQNLTRAELGNVMSSVAAQQCTDLQILEYLSTKGQLVCCETLKGHIDGNTKEA